MQDAPLILTLQLDADSQAFFNRLRQRHFPPERNYLEAHCTLFHHLPPAARPAIEAALHRRCAAQAPFPMLVKPPTFTGRGVAYPLESPALLQCHRELQRDWWDSLTPQDRQGYRPHITVQNKVDPETARSLHAGLRAVFPEAGMTAGATGLRLWAYLGGPWEPLCAWDFTG